jgi:hypothetical protein
MLVENAKIRDLLVSIIALKADSISMAQANVPFDKRLKQIVRKHEKLSKGGVKTVTSDGLIVVKPRVYRPKFPLKGMILLIVVGFLFKGLFLASVGEVAYGERVNGLMQGSVMDRAGAWVMQIDPATLIIANFMSDVLN